MTLPEHHVETNCRAASYAAGLLTEWARIVREYCRKVGSDAPFWHGERPQVGLLAAAAWRQRLVALAEFSQTKTFETPREQGRSDLWIKSKADEEFLEARYVCWPTGTATIAPLRFKLAETLVEAGRLIPDETTTAVAGVVFWSPCLIASSLEDVADELHRAVAVARDVRADALAWCFPKDRRLSRPEGTPPGQAWPGTFVFVSWSGVKTPVARAI